MEEALACKKTGEAKVIAFNSSSHGLLGVSAYAMFLAGKIKEFFGCEDYRVHIRQVNDQPSLNIHPTFSSFFL